MNAWRENKHIFFVDEINNISKSYNQFLYDLNSINQIKKYVFNKNPYEVFLGLICALVHGVPITLLDYDFSEQELNNIGLNKDVLIEKITVPSADFKDIVEVFEVLLSNAERTSITLYTSGTTGRPKKVEHTLKSLIRTTKIADKYKKNVWGFTYNPTHFAGIQVFLQAFLNENTIVNLFHSDLIKIDESFSENKITNISGTPTFYRLLTSRCKDVHQDVRFVTFGGEQYDINIVEKLKVIFPKAKFINIYASTEAGALFRTHSDYFSIDESLKKYIKISDNGELLIHKAILGKSIDLKLNEDWYNSGDIVQLVSENKFKFISRKNEMINVGGYKVNPNEIEKCIMDIDGVRNVLVYGRKNRITGNIIAADVVANEDIDIDTFENSILEYLKDKLQDWKIPRIIKFVNNIEVTRSGKKVRK